jgi:hypothetical protein
VRLTELGNPQADHATREKLILAGLFLSKFDSKALASLGFETFTEAFNVIGYGLGARPASVKNYRDEFDPLFPNPRVGWHKRPLRGYCREVYETYRRLDFESLKNLVKSFFDESLQIPQNEFEDEETVTSSSGFAQRLVTGQAAERYFESVYSDIPEFHGRVLENTTNLGCGYDFCLRVESRPKDYFAIEVKGVTEATGSVSMTQKEFSVAEQMKDQFFLFVVKNFREKPFHSFFRDPIACGLDFRRIERTIVQVSWSTRI